MSSVMDVLGKFAAILDIEKHLDDCRYAYSSLLCTCKWFPVPCILKPIACVIPSVWLPLNIVQHKVLSSVLHSLVYPFAGTSARGPSGSANSWTSTFLRSMRCLALGRRPGRWA